MKKNQISRGTRIIAIAIIAVFACSVAWIKPGKGKPAATSTTVRPTQTATATTQRTEEGQLVFLLESDGLINEVKGFLVEKKQDALFINGKQVPDNVACKYISSLKQRDIRVEVYPFLERLKMHPEAGFMQVLLPVMLSSPCVDTKPKKEGC